MAMEKATQENVFVGAVVVRGKDKFHVYKVNAKSLYIGSKTEKVIADKWENKPLGMKWVDFMKKHDGEKASYDGLTLSTEEAKKKNGFLAIKEARESMKDWLGKAGKKKVNELFELSKPVKNKRGKIVAKGKSVQFLRNDVGKNKIYIIKIRDDGHILLRLNDAYLFYDINTEVYTRFNKELHKNGKEIIFPEAMASPEERKIAV